MLAQLICLIATMEAPVAKSTDPRKGAGLRYIFSRALSNVEATGSNNSYRRVVLGFLCSRQVRPMFVVTACMYGIHRRYRPCCRMIIS